MTAEQRLADVVKAAVVEFGARGYKQASTKTIAHAVGISEPYLFRLFDSKHALFLAAVEYHLEVTERSMREAADGLTGHAAIAAMSTRYRELIAAGDLLPLQLQMCATAIHDDACRQLAAIGLASLRRMLAETTQASPDEIERFMSRGVLLNVLSTLGISLSSGRDAVQCPGTEGAEACAHEASRRRSNIQ